MKKERKCKSCPRIIVDPNNKTGICPKCKDKGYAFVTGISAILVVAVKCYKWVKNKF